MLKSLIFFTLLFITGFSTSITAEIKVLAISGSTRDGSFNKKLVNEAARLAGQKKALVTVVDLKNFPIPFYDADLEEKQGMPLKAKQFKQLMVQSDFIIISSPEYNASVSAVLKNALDWASRSEDGGASREAFKGKKFLLMSVSPGQKGGARGLIHLRAIIEDVGGTVLPQQVIVGGAYSAFDKEGHLVNEKAKRDLQQAIDRIIN